MKRYKPANHIPLLSLLPWDGGLKNRTFTQHLVGQKMYELTSHLGNVQAVISDQRYVRVNEDNSRLFRAAVPALYDYYPFGMLMPERFKQDSASHCMVSTQTMLVPVTIKVAGPVSGPLVPVLGGTGTVITGGVLVSSHSPGDGVSVSTPVTAGLTVTLELEVSQLSGAPFAVLVKEPAGAQDVVLGGATLSASGMYKVTVTPGGSTLKLVYVGSGVGSVLVKPWTWTKSLLTPKNVPVLVCNETEDYRFGFNGQEKVNEIAGVGNHTTALFWEYDTRIARRWNRDPKKKDWESDYSVLGLNPIINIDPLGDDWYKNKDGGAVYNKDLNGRRGMKKLGLEGEYIGKKMQGQHKDSYGNRMGVSGGEDGQISATLSGATVSAKGPDRSLNILQATERGMGNDPDGSGRAAAYKRAHQGGYLPYNPDVIGLTIPTYSVVGLNGGAGSINIGFFPKSREFGVWTTNGLAVGTPDVSVGFGFFGGEYRGQGVPDMASYMGYGRSGSVSFLGFSAGYSQGLEEYNGRALWHTLNIGYGVGIKTLPIVSGQYQPVNYTIPLIRPIKAKNE